MAWWNPMTWFEASRRAAGRMLRAWRIVRAKFDAAQTTPDNRRHWANADLLSADASASPATDNTLLVVFMDHSLPTPNQERKVFYTEHLAPQAQPSS